MVRFEATSGSEILDVEEIFGCGILETARFLILVTEGSVGHVELLPRFGTTSLALCLKFGFEMMGGSFSFLSLRPDLGIGPFFFFFMWMREKLGFVGVFNRILARCFYFISPT